MIDVHSGDVVMAARVRSCDAPQYVALDINHLRDLNGTTIGLEQCDGCGCCRYKIVGHYVVCDGDEYDDGTEQTEISGCGARYLIGPYLESEVQF
jgi:hypothetical protein